MELGQLQSQFARALHYQANGEECNIVSNHFTADDRLQIYRNNFIISLSEVLSATYPIVELLVGEECFCQLARHHILHYPLTQGDVSDYGDHFTETLEHFPTVIEAAPYLPEVVQFEWSMDTAFHRAGYPIGDNVHQVHALAELSPEQQGDVVLQLYPSVQLISSSYALFELYNAVQNNCFDSLDIHSPQQGVILALPNGHRTPMAIDPEVFKLIDCIHQQMPLGLIPPNLLTHLNVLMEKALVAGFTLDNK
ncbi:HvfC/BufC N-terminal domain-containing protein [Vibrio agarivorans]|uniref:HvfC/BufC N-terminal domain-containing protein n=1 Tax=Vibrio agarivorans TaxID=153622 RepID=UPI00223020DA|nr:DNA-binding domain-containing protein [Vibrio agarivorans]